MQFKITESSFCLWVEFSSSGQALSLEGARELGGVVKAYCKSRKPVVVAARGRVFCSGGNLTDYKKLKTKAAGLKVNREIARHLDAFAAWPAPKLAVVEGDVLGGGLEWLARFDFRWSVPHALFGFWQRRIGLSTGWGGGRVWAEKIGEERLRKLLLEARLLSAYEARDLGLIDRVVSATQIRAAAEEWARTLAKLPEIGIWSAAREPMQFNSLWMGPAHKAALERWG